METIANLQKLDLKIPRFKPGIFITGYIKSTLVTQL